MQEEEGNYGNNMRRYLQLSTFLYDLRTVTTMNDQNRTLAFCGVVPL